MTLRDVGNWFASVWDSAIAGFHIAATHSFWDWPIWVSIPLVIGVLWIVLWATRTHVREMRGKVQSLSATVGFGIAAAVCAYVTYDQWVGKGAFFNGGYILTLLRIGYVIMTTVFGFAFLHGLMQRSRHAGDQSDEHDTEDQ